MTSQTLALSTLLRSPVTDVEHHRMGTLADVIVRLRQDDYPLVTGLVVAVGGTRIFVSASDLARLAPGEVALGRSTVDLREFTRREGEVLLSSDVLGHRLIDLARVAFVKAYDVQLTGTPDGWTVTGLDVHKRRWLGFGPRHAEHEARDWRDFEPLIGHSETAQLRTVSQRVTELKAAQIADIVEDATDDEQRELLAQVHSDPELEADVFQELDEDQQSDLFRDRSDEEVARVIGHMEADDAADAVMDLPQERRKPVLAALPERQRAKIMRLLGYHEDTAGGLMGTDYLLLPSSVKVSQALDAVRAASHVQAQALAMIFTSDDAGRLDGAATLSRLIQAAPEQPLSEVVDDDVVVAWASDDVVDVTRRMADFNLLAMPVVTPERSVIGVITVDDALEAAIPEDWSRRENTHRETGSEG